MSLVPIKLHNYQGVNIDQRIDFDYIAKDYSNLWRPIGHGNFEVTQLILGLVAQNTNRNA